jgi:hypothetical protein
MPKKFAMNWNKISDMVKKDLNKKDYTDKRFYTPKMKTDGTFEAIIRFLPSIDTDLPYAKYMAHGFSGKNNRWLVENCPTTLGNQCPICEANGELWSTGLEENKKIVRKRARKTNYVSNILIVKDPQVPENNGKVFLYRYGKKISEKINDKMFPKEGAVDEPVMVADYYEGANFKLSIKMIVANKGEKPMPNYDLSSFKEKSEVGDDTFIESIRKETFPLAEFVDPKNFKSYEELKIKYETVCGGATSSEEKKEPDKKEEDQNNTVVETPIDEKKEIVEPDLNLTDDNEDDFLKKLQS